MPGHAMVTVDSIAIDNGVVGEPQVQCSEDAVSFSVRTGNRFTGNIFIKGQFSDPTCRQEYFSNTFNGASFTVRIGQCGMRRIRQLQPNGINYVVTFVVNFHNQFITKVDRAYNVRCFYAQEDKVVTSQLEVSMIATTELTAQTMLMPNCEYSVRADTLNGPRVRFARVGDRLVHRWECDNPNFGMLVKNCFVNDGLGSSVRVLDARGCPVFTPVVQGPLNYDSSLNLAYVEVWAYKFPDRANLFFQCQIQICNKREGECIGVTPPNCPVIPKSEFTGSATVVGGTDYGPAPPIGVPVVGGPVGQYGPAPPPVGVPVVGVPIPGYPAGTAPVVGGQPYVGSALPGTPYVPGAAVIGGLPIGRPYRERSKDEVAVAANISEVPVVPRNFSSESKKARRALHDNGTPLAGGVAQVTNDEVLDVTSDTVLIVDLDDSDSASKKAVGTFALDTERKFGEGAVCLQPLRLGLLMACFACMTAVIVVLLCYIARGKAVRDDGAGACRRGRHTCRFTFVQERCRQFFVNALPFCRKN